MSLFKNYSNLPSEIKKILINLLCKILLFSLFILYLFIFSPLNTNSTNTQDTTSISLNDELTLNVSNFNSNSYLYNTDIENFLTEIFSTRNQSFLDGSVEKLYNYYNTDNINGKLSLKYEFKRIAYLRDWAIERKIIFKNITSSITIKDIKTKDSKITIKVMENCDFTYIYTNSPLDNKFNVQLLHTLTLNTIDNKLTIDKDYFLDFFGKDVNKYSFSLKEKTIPYSKSVNKDFFIDKKFKIDEILNYTKFTFTDHKAVVSGYDHMGYPLVNCTTLKTNNIPFDFGWDKENIK